MNQPLSNILEKFRKWDLSQWADGMGITGLLLYSFGVFYRDAIVHRGLFLMALALGLKLKFLDGKVVRDRLLILSIGFLLFLSMLTFMAVSEFKKHDPLILEGALKALQLGFFVLLLVAFWMSRYPHLWDWCVVCLFAGHIVRLYRKLDWATLPDSFHLIWTGADRLRLGSTVNRFALWNAVILFACIILRENIWGARTANYSILFWSRVLFWALVSLVAAAGLVFSQSRSAWLAAVLVMPTVYLYRFLRQKRLRLKSIGIGAGIILLACIFSNLPAIVGKRIFSPDHPSFDTTTTTAIDQRLLLYRLAWEKWRERPWVGFGPGTSEIIVKQAGDEYAAVRVWDHFHNVAFDIMVQMGLVGIIFYGLHLYLIFRQLFIGKKNGSIEPNYYVFTFGSLAMIMIAGIFGQPFGDYKGIFLFGFLGGICYQSRFIGISPRRMINLN
jgi:O-antigen ligase